MTRVPRSAVVAILVAGMLASTTEAQGADECTAADDVGSSLGPIPYNSFNCSDTAAPATTGLPQPTCVNLTEDIWFRWTAPMSLDNHSVRFAGTGGPWIMLWEGAACGSAIDVECGTGLPIYHVVTGGQTYLIQLGDPITSGGSIGSGTLSMTDNGLDTCASLPDDGLEENDTCLKATPTLPGVYTDLVVTETDPDYYAISLDAGRVLSASVTSVGSQGSSCRALYDANCNRIFGVSPGNYHSGDSAQTVIFEVTVCGSSQYPCAVYDLTITDSPDPCFGQPDGDDETCDSAVPLAVGLTEDLWVSHYDEDYYSITLPPDASVTLRRLSNGSTGAVPRLALYEGVSACEVADLCTGAVACSFTELNWQNTTGTSREYIVLASIADQPGHACTSFDLELEVTGRAVGTSYCTATTNSAGTAASIRAEGSSAAADANLTLITEGVVPNRPGIYFFGTAQVQSPFGNGFRCAGGQVQRIQPTAFADGAGETRRVLQFGAPYAANIVPGANLNFQLWYRDAMAGMSGYNLSDGVNVVFQ